MQNELLALGRLALFLVGMVVIALPMAVGWSALRGSAFVPAMIYLATFVAGALLITGGVR
jgi:hypothetical protein